MLTVSRLNPEKMTGENRPTAQKQRQKFINSREESWTLDRYSDGASVTLIRISEYFQRSK
jgi:hypothetical protein